MDMDQTQRYLSDTTAEDPVWHHIFDPLDADGGPFQALAVRCSAVAEAAEAHLRDAQGGTGTGTPEAPALPLTGRTGIPSGALL